MKSPPLAKLSAKAPTGITDFDEITGGGLPRGRTQMEKLRGSDAAKPGRK